MLALTCAAVRRDASQTSTAWADLPLLLFSYTPRTSEPSLPCTRKQLFNICSPKLFNQSIRAKSDSKKLCTAHLLFLQRQPPIFREQDISSALEKAFPGFRGDFFVVLLPRERGVLFSTHELLAFCQCHLTSRNAPSMVSFFEKQSHLSSRSLNNRVISVLGLCGVDIHIYTHLGETSFFSMC